MLLKYQTSSNSLRYTHLGKFHCEQTGWEFTGNAGDLLRGSHRQPYARHMAIVRCCRFLDPCRTVFGHRWVLSHGQINSGCTGSNVSNDSRSDRWRFSAHVMVAASWVVRSEHWFVFWEARTETAIRLGPSTSCPLVLRGLARRLARSPDSTGNSISRQFLRQADRPAVSKAWSGHQQRKED